jgi:subtilisin-like proprotein convertase family protein
MHHLSILMKTSPLRSLATFAALRFKFFSSASHAVGDKWADPAGRALPFLREQAPRSPRLRVSLHPNKPLRLLCVLCGFAVTSSVIASTTWNGPTWSVSTLIPDNDEVGFVDTRTINIPQVTEIENVTVHLNFSGGWNGDLYAYVLHDSGFAVLLNRPGRSLSALDGSATVGMQVTFDDSAFADIHTAIPLNGGAVTGTYQPDGRETDPYNTLNSDARTAMLADFIGLDPNGEWKLFVADQSPGETSTLQSWSMTLTAVPEPSVALLGGLGVLFLLRRKPR